ncbi:MAG: DUF2149 domain-containing protein [Acidobacteriota bacterium]
MSGRRFDRSRFDDSEVDPLGPLANLVDIMLVFACGLIAALALARGGAESFFQQRDVVEKGRELPTLPESLSGGAGEGMEPVGQVFRDPETGKLILVGQ